MSFYADVNEKIKPYITDDAARAAVCELVNFVRTAEAVLRGDSDDNTRRGMAQVVTAFTVGLNDNPFWREHSGYMLPVFATAVSAWMDSFGYLATDGDRTDRAAFLVTQNVLPEIAVAALYCAHGVEGVKNHSMPLRRTLLSMERTDG